MVPIQSVKNGMCRFVDTELVSQMSGWQKIAVSTAAGLLINRLGPELEKLPMGLYENGQVDVDAIYQEARKHWNQAVPIAIPFIGTVTLTGENLDTMYNMIVNG